MSSWDEDLVENQEFSVATTDSPLAINDKYMTDSENLEFDQASRGKSVARRGILNSDAAISVSRVDSRGP